MGRKKGKSRQQQQQQEQRPIEVATAFEDLGSPSVVVPKNSNFGDDEVVIPPNHNESSSVYKTVYLSGEDVSDAVERKLSSRDSNSSIYHDLIDGGAYDRFRRSRQSSRTDFDGAGDRVMAGSRSISHRSLFNDDRSFGAPANPSKISLAGSKLSIEWEDMKNGGTTSSRRSTARSVIIGGDSEEAARKPFVRSRTVSSGGSQRNSVSQHQPLTISSSQRALDSNQDVRTYHAGSEYLQNRLSKLSIHSNNDEFVLVGGHPPEVVIAPPVPRPRSRISSFSENIDDAFLQKHSSEEELGRSVSQQSLGRGGHPSRSSSRFSMGTNSNTDDRLILAERYSRSPEAEGLTLTNHMTFPEDRTSSRLSTYSAISEHQTPGVGFVEIPTLYSHPDEKFDDDDDEPGEPFRPTSEHSATPTNNHRVRSSLIRSDAVEESDGRRGFRSSSSSLSNHHDQPSTPLLVTSALTPVIPKRHPQRSMSHSEESLVMRTPQTVQKSTSAEQKASMRLQSMEKFKKTVEIAVQTGNSIRLRQNQHFGDVLSECAYLPESRGFGLSPTTTASFIPHDEEDVFIPRNTTTTAMTSAASQPPASNSIRARLRHISDIYSNDAQETPILTQTNYVRVPKAVAPEVVLQKPISIRKATQEIVVPIGKPVTIAKAGGSVVEIPKSSGFVEIPKSSEGDRFVDIPKSSDSTSTKDTIRKHIPRGRIRDLASAFDKMTDGSPVRPLEFKSQVHIPSAREENLWNSRKPSGGPTTITVPYSESVNDGLRADSRLSGPLSGPLNGSSSSAFRSSTQTIRSQEDRRRSTSSSLHQQPHVFTRNTFLTSSSAMKPGNNNTQTLPTNVAMTTHFSRDNLEKTGGFLSAFEKASSTHLHSDDTNDNSQVLRPSTTLSLERMMGRSPTKETTFSEYSRKVEVPISGVTKFRKQRLAADNTRAKTQEIPSGTFEFESRYESRAVSGDLNDENPTSVFGVQKPLFAASREAFGRDTAEDLRGKQTNWPPAPRQHQWTSSEFHMSNTNSMVSSPMFSPTTTNSNHDNHHQHTQPPPSSTITTINNNNNQKTINEYHHHRINSNSSSSKPIPVKIGAGKPTVVPVHHHRQSISSSRHPYSPPATEDAGSRITHHTSQTLQSEDLFATEDSSIRGKIDRMFDFVETDDSSRKALHLKHLESNASTDTIGTTTNQKFQPHQDPSRLLGANAKTPAEMPQALRSTPPKMKSPERRNTVTVPSEFDLNELEYSLSQYREMQREQLRRRLPSADEPQFFRSPTLSAPHAGQSMHAYRTKDLMGTPTAGEKFRFPSTSSGVRAPVALATSTPVDSPSGRSYSIKDPFQSSHHLELNNNNNNNSHSATASMAAPPNETFVSSISGVSAVEKHVDVMRKINRLSYMMENTQKQMSMNEAALTDAVKKGRRSQEIAAHRSILISRETLRLQRNELRRLHAFSAVRRPPPPVAKELRGSVIFKNLVVQLNKLFVTRLTAKDDNTYFFVGLFKFGHQVEATELISLRVYPGEETCDKLFFVKQIQFSDVPVDFMVTIEIYMMRVPAAKPVELSLGTSFANKCKSLMGPPQKKSSVALETAFKFRGRLVLDRDAAGDRCLFMEDVTYPLEGTVMISTQCSRLPESFEIDFRGFLTMFLTISNMASWERYWAVLRRGVVLFWKYPDDEQMGREPKMQIDLTKCTNNSIEKCSPDLCPKSDSFVIEILVDAEDGTIGSVVEKKRVLLSADSSEMLAQWLFTLNQTLDVIRGPI